MVSLLDCRKTIDETLGWGSLSDKRLLQEYIREQLEGQDGEIPFADIDAATNHRTDELWGFLEDMRSLSLETSTLKSGVAHQDTRDPSTGHDREWKLKDDNGVYRVLYRKGPEGTPFHVLCLEGIIEGPATMALCIAWEAPHFKEWWPSFSVPPFKIIDSKWAKRIRPGNDVATIRFKVPWPFATREIAVSAFEVEVAERGAIVAVMKSVPEDINEAEEGYGIGDVPPPGPHVVRMNVNGGYILQQIDAKHCFFRTISNIDMKIDLVPPWMINFLSRQLAGNGFVLFRETVDHALQNKKGGGAVFQRLVQSEPLYLRVSAALEAHLKLQEARRLIAAGKEPDVAHSGEAYSSVLQSRQDDEEGQLVEGKGEEEDIYAGLEGRDPEVFHAVHAIDRAIALLRANNAILGRGLSRSSSHAKSGHGSKRDLFDERTKSAADASSKQQQLAAIMQPGSALQDAPINSSEGMAQKTGPLPTGNELVAGGSGKAANKLHGTLSEIRHPLVSVDEAGVTFSGAIERMHYLKSMSGRQGTASVVEDSRVFSQDPRTLDNSGVPTAAEQDKKAQNNSSNGQTSTTLANGDALENDGRTQSAVAVVSKKKKLFSSLWKKRFAGARK